jgi:hypothetical protein
MTGKINFLSVIFYYGGIMKRFLSILMCIFILTISVITYFPFSVKAADNDFTLSNEGINLSSGEANNAVKNKGDIYTADHLILFRYTPTSDYNWTYVNQNIHLSDAQVVALLMSDNKYEVIAKLAGSAASHSVITRGMLAALGVLTTGDSDIFNSFFDMLTSNYNYLNAIEYDPQAGDLTLLADQVTALRNELKERYYDSIGLIVYEPAGTPQSLISSIKTKYEHEEDFQSDYVDIKDREYVFSCIDYRGVRAVFRYVFSDTPSYFYWNGKDGYFVDGSNIVVMNSNFDILDWDYVTYYSSSSSIVPTNLMFNNLTPLRNSKLIIHSDTYSCGNVSYYSDSDMPFKVWASYESLYNYIHGSQNAYLSSKVEEAGEDIKLSINNMNDNIGSKMDELIDSINNKKDGMSADELQKAIDKALDSISGKIDDIGDNTQQTNNKLDALLESVSGTNQILMQILGVTTDIRDIVKTKNEEGNQYTLSDVKDCFNTMFNNLKYSILYGKNVTNNPDAANVSTVAYVSYSDVSTYADTSAETLDYKDGLFGKFPFSVPYQMYEWLQVLQVDEKVPQFTYNYGFLIGQKGKQEYDLTFDLSKYQPWADVLKSFLRLSFTLIMSVFIYNKFKGEM